MNDNHSLEFLHDLKYKVMTEGEVLTRRSTIILIDKMIEMKGALAKQFEDWRDQYEENVRNRASIALYEAKIKELEKEIETGWN